MLAGTDDVPGARAHLDEAMRLATSIGDEIGTAYIGRLLAGLDVKEGRPELALQRLARARAVFEKAGNDDMVHVTAVLSASALLKAGRPADALKALEDADALRKRLDSAERDVDHWHMALLAHARLGNLPQTGEAAEAYARALSRREGEARRRAVADVSAQFELAQRDAENRRLKEQQEAAAGRQFWLGVSLLLMLLLLGVMGWHALVQRRERQRLRTLAEVDELTQLPNRRAILETLRLEIQRASALSVSLSVAICDIDHFKSVNDHFGHDVGDEALRCFAQAGHEALRRGDALGRLGGEEFLIILPTTLPAHASAMFERLCARLRQTPVRGMPPDERLTFSMGVAAWRPGLGADEVLHEADQALYRAKRTGRDRVEVGV
jgi:diguanylate cyclase (GGDEF)-like protein